MNLLKVILHGPKPKIWTSLYTINMTGHVFLISFYVSVRRIAELGHYRSFLVHELLLPGFEVDGGNRMVRLIDPDDFALELLEAQSTLLNEATIEVLTNMPDRRYKLQDIVEKHLLMYCDLLCDDT